MKGISANFAALICAHISNGHKIIMVRPVNGILGAELSYLY
jgi:hypothetical protein